MARIFITGSADGLGQLAAQALIQVGHQVALHARNAERAKEALKKNPGAETVFTADLSNMNETKDLAVQVNEAGSFDAVIHNAGVYQTSNKVIFTVNTLAPYILTCLIQKPKRLIYLSSGMHTGGDATLDNIDFSGSRISYSDSKLHDVILSFAVARKWPGVLSNAVNPGWVPTKMGGKGAPDNLDEGFETQAWLAASDDEQATVSGHYFRKKKPVHHRPEASDVVVQEKLLRLCEQITGIRFPE
jgi:NAD(P)-dependent dehydrogenase (short-subunit alcohol dehydrogenase family)